MREKIGHEKETHCLFVDLEAPLNTDSRVRGRGSTWLQTLSLSEVWDKQNSGQWASRSVGRGDERRSLNQLVSSKRAATSRDFLSPVSLCSHETAWVSLRASGRSDVQGWLLRPETPRHGLYLLLSVDQIVRLRMVQRLMYNELKIRWRKPREA